MVAPAGTHDITGSEHLTLLEVAPANLRILPTWPPVGGQTLTRHLALPLWGMGSELRFSSFCGKYFD